jgi:outer membrane protein assembly factor BamB
MGVFRWVVLVGATMSTGGAVAGDWPCFHGPTHDGHAVGERLAEGWPAGGPRVVWSREVGTGYSSIVVEGTRAYTQTQSLYDQAVECLDTATGKTIWRVRYGLPYDGGGLYPGPRSTPAVHAGRVYVHSPEGYVGCFDAITGAVRWSVDLAATYGLKGTDFGCASSPVVGNGRVYLPAGGDGAMLVALDAATGTLAWKAGRSPASYATPLPIEWQGQPLLVVPGENTLAAFHAVTGELWWEIELSSGYDEHSCAPLYSEPRLMLASPFRAGARQWELVREESTGRCKPVRVWDNLKFSNDVASSLLVDNAIFGFDLRDAQSRLNRASRGEFRCLDWLTGKTLWSTREVGHANGIAADGKLVLFNDQGELILVKADPTMYVELGRARVFTDEICWSSPALSSGMVYLRTPTRAVCLDLSVAITPAETANAATAKTVEPEGKQPDASDRRVLVPTASRRFDPTVLLGGEREFPAMTPDVSELARWYNWSLAGLFGAALIAGLIGLIWSLITRRRGAVTGSAETRPKVVEGLFWLLLSMWGLLGSPLLNGFGSEVGPDAGESSYVFLWPVVLWVAMHGAIVASRWARGASFRHRRKWLSYAAGCAFLCVAGLYFHFCRLLGLAPEWAFLAGFLPAIPVSVAGCVLLSRWPEWRGFSVPMIALVSFSVYYWSSVWFMTWRLVVGG